MPETPHFLKLFGVEPKPGASPEELAGQIDAVVPKNLEQQLGQLSSVNLEKALGGHPAVLAFLRPKKEMPAGTCRLNIQSNSTKLASATPRRHSSRNDLSNILTNDDIGVGSLEQSLLEN